MKKLAFLMMAAACFVLTACPSGQPENTDNETIVENTEVTEPVQQEAETPATVDNDMYFYVLNHEFEVTGTPDIESFVKALPIYDKESGFFDQYEDEEMEYALDKDNGFFHYYYLDVEDYIQYESACWDRTDGKKLMIFTYNQYFCNTQDGAIQPANPVVSPWYYAGHEVNTWEDEDGTFSKDVYSEGGFVAYLYNDDTHMLEPLSEPPFNGWNPKATYRYLVLPQDGSRDIEVVYGDEENSNHMLKWNGMTFDYQE